MTSCLAGASPTLVRLDDEIENLLAASAEVAVRGLLLARATRYGRWMPEPEHLKMIQEVVARLAGNSSQMKRWTVVVVAALLGFAASGSDRLFAVVALYAVVALAALDAYYLALERVYRRLYDAVVAGEADPWSMKAQPVQAVDVLRAVASPSVWLLYVATAASVIAVLLSA